MENQDAMAALEAADVIVVQSPNYCMEMTGQLKIFMDHMAYRWMSHRPHPAMFGKVGVVISTTAGAGAGQVTKSLKRQLFYWGVVKVYQILFAVNATGWPDVSKKINRNVEKIAAQVPHNAERAKPGFKTRSIFTMMRGMQGGNTWMPRDNEHWEKNDWLGKARP